MAETQFIQYVDMRQLAKYYERRSDLLAKYAADRVLQIIQQEFDAQGTDEGAWEDLNSATLVIRGTKGASGDEKVLQDSSFMKDSFRVEQIDAGHYIITSRSPKRVMIHEFGTRITVTDKMRRFLAANGVRISDAKTEIVIPERPIIRPAFAKMMRELPREARARLSGRVTFG